MIVLAMLAGFAAMIYIAILLADGTTGMTRDNGCYRRRS